MEQVFTTFLLLLLLLPFLLLLHLLLFLLLLLPFIYSYIMGQVCLQLISISILPSAIHSYIHPCTIYPGLGMHASLDSYISIREPYIQVQVCLQLISIYILPSTFYSYIHPWTIYPGLGLLIAYIHIYPSIHLPFIYPSLNHISRFRSACQPGIGLSRFRSAYQPGIHEIMRNVRKFLFLDWIQIRILSSGMDILQL